MNLLLDNVLPVFVLMALGNALMRTGLAGEAFFKVSDRLVYFIFFPALLFWKVNSAFSTPGQVEKFFSWEQVLGVLAALILTWLGTLLYIQRAKVPPFQAGTFSQVSFRFNSYVGMAIAISAFGEGGAASFGLLISLAIPLINLLAVGTLVWFSQSEIPAREKTSLMLRSILLNPLILSCAAGIAWGSLGPGLPVFVDRTLALLSSITLPLALLSIGGGLTWAKMGDHLRLSLVSCFFGLIVLPLTGYFFLWLGGVKGLPLQTAMVFLTLPTATSSYILSVQLKSDSSLAAAAIVLSTLLSFLSLSLALLLFA